jgi:hypothetical protein
VATDLPAIVRNLGAFYPFDGRTVVAVGAGGGRLIGYARGARHLVAVDPDRAAMHRLASAAKPLGLGERLTLLDEDWLDARATGDVVLFEFCLHAMRDPGLALDRAREAAPDVVVLDHAPGSPWEWLAAEDGAVDAAWAAAEARGIARSVEVLALQRFEDFDKLEARLKGQGAECHRRLVPWRGRGPIEIEMPYRIAQVGGARPATTETGGGSS